MRSIKQGSRARWDGGAVLVLVLASWPIGTQARTMAERTALACGADVRRLCPSLDEDRTKACMLGHRSQVEPACMRLIDASE